MTRTLTTLFRLLGYPTVTLALFLMLAGPAVFLNWFSQHNPNLAYVLGYLLAFYARAIAAGFNTGFNKGTMFSTKILIEGVWCLGLLAGLHLGLLLFHFGSFGGFLILVFLFAFAQEGGIIVPKRHG